MEKKRGKKEGRDNAVVVVYCKERVRLGGGEKEKGTIEFACHFSC